MYTLKKLSGSPKQIKWAETIRAAYVSSLMAEQLEEAKRSERTAFIGRLTDSAKDWIEGRLNRYAPMSFKRALELEKQAEADRKFAKEADDYDRWYSGQYGQY